MKNSRQRRLAAWLLDHKVGAVAVVCAISLVFGYQLRDPRVLVQSYDREEKRDDSGEELKKLAQTFGEGELLMVVVKAGDVFTPEVLSYVRARTEAIAALPHVMRVDSLTAVQDVVMQNGSMTTRPLFDEIPSDPDVLKSKKKTVLSNPLWVNNLVSSDTTVTVLNVFLPPLMRGSKEAAQVIGTLHELVDAGKPPSVDVYLTGLTPMFQDSKACTNKDFSRFFVLTWVLMAVVLFFSFRTLTGVLLPLGLSFLPVFWTLGLMSMAGQGITAIGAMLPTLIGVTCFSDSVHLLSHYHDLARRSDNRREAIIDTMTHMITACFMTSATTAVAFASLTVSKVSSIRQFGFWAGVGIMLGYVLVIVLMPIFLSWLPMPRPRVRKTREHSLCDAVLVRVARLSRAGNKWLPLVVILLAVCSLVAATHLRVETSLTAFLPESAPAMRGLAVVQEKMVGFGSVEVVLEGPKGCFGEPWALKELCKLEAYVEKRSEVGVARSIMDLLQWTHGIMEETDDSLLDDPDARGLIAEYLFLYAGSGQGKMLASFITGNHSVARIGARLRVAGAGEQVALVREIEDFASQHLDKRLTCRLTGEADRFARQINDIFSSLTDSSASTALLIFILMFALLRSARAAILSMIPNVLPVLWTLGIMAVGGITLNFATVMITSIAIGIAVDDTIHFLVYYRRELQTEPDIDKAVNNTIIHCGRAMIATSAAVAAGCGVFVLSDFSPSRVFGFLMALTMLTALLADLIILPYLVRTWKLRFTPRGKR